MLRQPLHLLFASLLALLALLMSGCSGAEDADPDLEQTASPVVGGMQASMSQIYSAAALTKVSDNSFVCSATLIAPTVGITAAHCIYQSDGITEYGKDQLWFVAGAIDVTQATQDQRYDITTITQYPGYSYSNDTLGATNDIAVLLLGQTITSISAVPTLPMNMFDSSLTAGTLVTLDGYGVHDPTNPGTLGQLYTAQTPFQLRTNTEFSAGTTSSPDTCGGDSGSPVYVTVGGTMYTAGMAARSVDQTCGDGGIYEALGAFDDWLRKASAGAYPPTCGGSGGGCPGSGASPAGCSCQVDAAPSSAASTLLAVLGVAVLALRQRRR